MVGRHNADTVDTLHLRDVAMATIFSERELTFTFAICYRPSVCCLSSVVCNVRVPYSGGSNFRQYFYGITYTLAIH